MVKAFLEAEWASKAYLLISAPHTLIPDGFGEEIELIRVHPADLEDMSQILKESLKNTPREWELLETAKQLKGLSESQIRGILRSLQGEYGISCGLDAGALPEVQRRCEERMRELIRQEKEKAAEKDPTIVLMDYDREQRGEEGKETPERAVGLDGLCQWLENRRDCFLYPGFLPQTVLSEEPPKGILVTGIPGTGKTLMAEEAARRLDDAALIRFQIDRIQSSSYGESESNMRRCLERIESMAPCVLLIDEAEKIFRMDEHTHEVKLNMLGQLLDWMQKEEGCCIYVYDSKRHTPASAGGFLRDGRISERFFAFMPSGGELAAILCEKLRRIDRETGKAV
ncbi:MAG: ATP-binding protein [Lachnospiraceae bacterium]